MTIRIPILLALAAALAAPLAGCGWFDADEADKGESVEVAPGPAAAASRAAPSPAARTKPVYESAPLPSASFFER